MVKLVYCLRRRPELSAEQFRSRWRQHAPIVESVRPALPAMRRYVQSHPLDEASALLQRLRGTAPAYDGIAEVWLESEEALRVGGPEALAATRLLHEDESGFIDFGSSSVFLTREHVVFGEG